MDEEGFLYLTDRKKDMIISGGENIASSEVERVVYELPQVLEAAVIGVADEQLGRAPRRRRRAEARRRAHATRRCSSTAAPSSPASRCPRS